MLRELLLTGAALCVSCMTSACSQAAPTPPPALVYSGAMDGSAGVALDNRYFVDGNDEDNVLRIYDRSAAGAPWLQLDLSPFLEVDPASPETDIEAATRIGNRIYWITSHARNKRGVASPSRQRFFATDIRTNSASASGSASSVPELLPVGKPCKTLLADLLAAPLLQPQAQPQPGGLNLAASAQRLPEEPDGLNIEGLAATPEGHLLIGFRNPLPGGRALIVPLLNPDAVLLEGRPAQFGKAIELDLGGLGIRDIAPWKDQFVIIAGPYNTSGHPQLFTWKGGNTRPSPMTLPSTALEGFTPEALVIYPDKGLSEFELLSDDSSGQKEKGSKRKTKGLEGKFFRGFWVNGISEQ
jgi:hypothetical protein